MARGQVAFETFVHGGLRLLVVAGELDLSCGRQFYEQFAAAVSALEPGGKLVVDLGAVEFFDSTGLWALVRGSRAANDAGLTWHVIVSYAVGRVLELAEVPQSIVPTTQLNAGVTQADDPAGRPRPATNPAEQPDHAP